MPLTVDAIPGTRLRFRLEGKLAEPNTARWKAATPDQRLSYWPLLADRLLVEWRGQMLAGRGRRGKLRRAKPISRLMYKQAGEAHQGPALLPRREESRAWRHARVTPYADLGRVTGFFVSGTARFLSYHHTGTAGRGIPYFDDGGRLVGWRGLRGQVTGIVRDLLPTATTIALAVSSASTRWARSLPKTPEPRLVQRPERAAARVKPRPLDFRGRPTGEINEWQRSEFADWEKSLTAAERRSLSDYGGNTYDAINRTLRTGTLDHWMNDWAREDVPLIDRAISRGKTPRELVVYRRVESLPFKVEVGGRITDPAFMSTSLEGEWLKRRGVGFARGELPQVYRIEVPAGTPVASMSGLGIAEEAEMLFGRDTTIEITRMTRDIDPEGNPIMLIDARMVPGGE